MSRFTLIGMVLSFLVAIYAVAMSQVESLPQWGLVVLALLAGFWWVAGQAVLGGKTRQEN